MQGTILRSKVVTLLDAACMTAACHEGVLLTNRDSFDVTPQEDFKDVRHTMILHLLSSVRRHQVATADNATY